MSRPSRRLVAPCLLLLGLVGLPTTVGAAGATAAPTTTSALATTTLTTAQFEARLVALTNDRRAKVGCVALRANTALVTAARRHTLRMVEAGQLSHRVAREASLATRIERAGYTNWRLLGENIAWGRGLTPSGVFSLWIKSAPHRANIQNCRFRDVGYGVRYSGGAVWVTGDYGRR